MPCMIGINRAVYRVRVVCRVLWLMARMARQGAPWRDMRKGRQAPTQFPNDCLSFYAVCDGHAGALLALFPHPWNVS